MYRNMYENEITSKSPTDGEEMSMERQLQINIILKILGRSLNKLRISLILPKIFENPISTRQRLSGSKYISCVDLIEDYIKEKNMDPTNVPPHLSYRLIKIIDFFHQNINVLEYFNDWLDDLRSFEKSLIDAFQLLLMVTEQRLKKSAISELNKEKHIHEVYQQNEKIKRKIKVFQILLKSRHINFKWKEVVAAILIQKYEKDLAKCKYENNIKIKQEIVRSSRNIRQIYVSNVAKQKQLEEDLERIRISYERLLEDNLQQEKSARDEKNKLILQFESLVKKFDKTMADKIKENMFLQEEYEKQKEIFDLFLIEYNREEAEYERIVRLRDEEDKLQHEQKIMLFMMNRAARVIQKHWRKFRRAQKKASKKNKARGKSKK